MKIKILALFVVALLAVAALVIPPAIDLLSHEEDDDGYGIEVVVVGPMAMLLWEAQGGEVYEVQGRMFKGEWSTIMITAVPRARVQVPLGIASYRVRPWTTAGPGQWSEPTQFVIRQLAPAPAPDPPRQDPRTLSEK